jgi:hypothetical protein
MTKEEEGTPRRENSRPATGDDGSDGDRQRRAAAPAAGEGSERSISSSLHCDDRGHDDDNNDAGGGRLAASKGLTYCSPTLLARDESAATVPTWTSTIGTAVTEAAGRGGLDPHLLLLDGNGSFCDNGAGSAVGRRCSISNNSVGGGSSSGAHRHSFLYRLYPAAHDDHCLGTPLLLPSERDPSDHEALDEEDPYDDDEGDGYYGPYTSSAAHATSTSATTTPRILYSTRRRAPLNGLNYLNVVTYALHLFVSWGIGVWGLGGHVQTRWQIANEHETLVTPSAFTLWIWYPILVLEGVFALAQLLPYYRARPIVQGGTSYWFFYTFVIQTGWTLFYSFQLFIFSFVAVLAALASLVGLLASQQASLSSSGGGGAAAGGLNLRRGGGNGFETRAGRLTEYYLFRFPFYLHTGWMAFCAAHHFSLLFRSYGAGVGLQVAIDVVSLGWLLPTALIFLACPHFKDFVIPLVIIWSYVGVACRLLHPSDAMMDLYGPVIVDALRITSIFFAGTVGASLVPNIFIWLAREFCTISVVELED